MTSKRRGVPRLCRYMKTIEFKTRLNQSRIATAKQWLEGCRRVWNMALGILEENQQWYWREKLILERDLFVQSAQAVNHSLFKIVLLVRVAGHVMVVGSSCVAM